MNGPSARPKGRRTQEEEEEFARLFKPNPQTHEQRLADPWTITNSITGEGTAWYQPPANNGASSGNEAGENGRSAQQEAEEDTLASSHPQADNCHYTAPHDQIPFFVSPNTHGAAPTMTPAEEYFATKFGLMPPQEFYGFPRGFDACSGNGTQFEACSHSDGSTIGTEHPVDAYQPLSPNPHPQHNAPAHAMPYQSSDPIRAITGAEQEALHNGNATPYQIRLHQRLGSKANFRFPARELAMERGDPLSEAAACASGVESCPKATAPLCQLPASASSAVDTRLVSQASSSGNTSGGGVRLRTKKIKAASHGLGYGIWRSGGLVSSTTSPIAAPISRSRKSACVHSGSTDGQGVAKASVAAKQQIIMQVVQDCGSITKYDSSSENKTRLPTKAELAKLMKAFEEEKRENAKCWANSVRQITEAYHKMYFQLEEVNTRARDTKKREAAMNNAQRELQQGMAQLNFERDEFVGRVVKKNEELAGAKDQIDRLKDRILALQNQVNALQQQKVELMRKVASQQQQQGACISMPPAQPPILPESQQQGFAQSAVAQPLAYDPDIPQHDSCNTGPPHHAPSYPGHRYQHFAAEYVPWPMYFHGEDQGVVSGPPAEEEDELHYVHLPPETPTPRHHCDAMFGWDSNQLHNDANPQNGIFGDEVPVFSQTQAPTTDKVFNSLDDVQSVPVTPAHKMTKVASPPLDPSDMSSPLIVERRIDKDNMGIISMSSTNNGLNLVAHPADDVFLPLTQSPPGNKHDKLKPHDYYSKPYTSLLNACFSKVEAAIRKMNINPVTKHVRAGDSDALEFVQSCKEHLINHREAWKMLDDENTKQYLVIGVVHRYVVEYAIFDGILTDFECEHQEEFNRSYEIDIGSANESYGARNHYAIHRARVATNITRLPYFSDWLRRYTGQVVERIIDEVKAAFPLSELPWLRYNLWVPINEGLNIGVRMLQDPRCFEFWFPKLGASWDNRFHIHRNPELVGQHIGNDNTPYVVRCAIRPVVRVTDYNEEEPVTLTVHRGEVLLSDNKLHLRLAGTLEEDPANRHRNKRCRPQLN